MNRQIKFRVWNGYEMVEDVTVGKHGAFWTSGISESDNQSLGNTTKYDNYLAVMQFTGLHDKNGKEIYEGDLVKLDGSNETWEILWLDAGLTAFTLDKRGLTNSLWRFPKTIEIIGNVFENPDLVKL